MRRLRLRTRRSDLMDWWIWYISRLIIWPFGLAECEIFTRYNFQARSAVTDRALFLCAPAFGIRMNFICQKYELASRRGSKTNRPRKVRSFSEPVNGPVANAIKLGNLGLGHVFVGVRRPPRSGIIRAVAIRRPVFVPHWRAWCFLCCHTVLGHGGALQVRYN